MLIAGNRTLTRRLLAGTAVGWALTGGAAAPTAAQTGAPAVEALPRRQYEERGVATPAEAPRSVPGISIAAGESGTVELPPVSVEADRPASGYRAEQPSMRQLTGPLLDTPQSITVVPRQLMEDRGITTMSDALRNVPGVSIAAGEAGAQGNSLTLRGFNARNDIFLDGMRDFGSYYRDPFDLEAIEVLKGPSSLLFGRGSTGGVVNQVSKAPRLDKFITGDLSFGTDSTKRGTADVNMPVPELGSGAAVRLNLMAHDSQLADRDVGEYRRFGIAPSLALGLGTPTRLTLSYFHLSSDDIPDYGLPFLFGRPADVPRHNYYGFEDGNFLRTDADIGTARLEHDATDWLTLRNQFRYAQYSRDLRITEPQIQGAVTPATPLGDITVARRQIAADSVETFLDNQLDAVAKFRTGFVGHTLVAGIEAGRETSDPRRLNYAGVPPTNLLDPDPGTPFSGTATVASDAKASAVSVGVYALDTVKLGEQWELTAGVRWDRFDADFSESVAGTSFSRTDYMTSWRTGLVYKPLPNGSVYFSYGTSFNPSAEALSLAANNANLPPEESESYEVGAKWDLFSERLALRGAIFRTEKNNARVTDPDNPLLLINGGKQRVDGFEIEAAGRITDRWQVAAGYAYQDSEVIETSTAANSPPLGSPLTNVPPHTFSLWSTYDATPALQFGGGVTYVGRRVARTTGTPEIVDDYYTIDLMAKYRLNENVALQLNIYNLTDEYYIDQIHPAHVIPGAGRSALFTTSFRF